MHRVEVLSRGLRRSPHATIRGFQVSRLLRLAADLNVADKVPDDGSRDVRELAAACGVLPSPLLRVLRALAAFDVFRVNADGHVSHSPRSNSRASSGCVRRYSKRLVFHATSCGMPPTQARLLIAEQMLEPDPKRGRPTTYLLDAQMMTMFGNARERTREEFDELLLASGLTSLRLIPTASVISIIEAAPS